MNAKDMLTNQNFFNTGSKRKILFATPFYEGKGWSDYVESIFRAVLLIGRYTTLDIDFMRLDGDAYVWRARNTIVKCFKESDFTELYFLDSDMGWDLDGMLRILMRESELIVGAGYPCKNNWDFYSCLINTNEDGTPKVNERGLIEANGGIVPTGFMKIRREVFDILDLKYPDNYYVGVVNEEEVKTMNYFGHLFEEHVPYGEDTSFCVRCSRAGIPLMVEPNVTIRHYGIAAREGNYHEYLMRQPGGSEEGNPMPGSGLVLSQMMAKG